jgi:hypothetical protein
MLKIVKDRKHEDIESSAYTFKISISKFGIIKIAIFHIVVKPLLPGLL